LITVVTSGATNRRPGLSFPMNEPNLISRPCSHGLTILTALSTSATTTISTNMVTKMAISVSNAMRFPSYLISFCLCAASQRAMSSTRST